MKYKTILIIALLSISSLFLTSCQNKDKPILVYTLPGSSDPNFIPIRQYCQSDLSDQFKTVFPSNSFNATRHKNENLVLFGTYESTPYIAQLLNKRNITIENEKITIGDREYELSDYLFYTSIKEGRRNIIISTGYNSDGIINKYTPEDPEPGFYQLINHKNETVESGVIKKSLWKTEVIPEEMNEDKAYRRKEYADKLITSLEPVMIKTDKVEEITPLFLKAEKSRLLFLGEGPHQDPAIHNVIKDLTLQLRQEDEYGYFATENLYSQWPVYEQYTMTGNYNIPNIFPKESTHISKLGKNTFLQAFKTFNSGKSHDERIIMTAIDVDHGINHTKKWTEYYFGYLASFSSSSAFKEEISHRIQELSGCTNLKSILSYLDLLEDDFLKNRDTFPEEIFQEIEFTLNLERDSARFQLPEKHESLMTYEEKVAYNEIRGRSFRATIEKAYDKATLADQKLICHVGGAHSTLQEFDHYDYPVGAISEARYFHDEYGKTKGETASFDVYNINKMPLADPVLQDLLLRELDSSKMIFLDFEKLSELPDSHLFPQFIGPDGYKTHGLIVIK